MLCVDELDKVNQTDWALELQTALIDIRYRTGLEGTTGTVFAMNTSPDTLPGWIASRMRDGRNVVVENPDADMRPAMQN